MYRSPQVDGHDSCGDPGAGSLRAAAGGSTHPPPSGHPTHAGPEHSNRYQKTMTAPRDRAPDPLHGVTLERMLTEMVAHFGWEVMGQRIKVRCFTSDPSIPSSLRFLRRTPWARERVESMYLYMLREQARRRRAAGEGADEGADEGAGGDTEGGAGEDAVGGAGYEE